MSDNEKRDRQNWVVYLVWKFPLYDTRGQALRMVATFTTSLLQFQRPRLPIARRRVLYTDRWSA